MLIDLSVPINEETPVYPGDPGTKVQSAGILSKNGFTDHYISLGTHIGTHIDAPMHMIEGGISLDKIPIEQFIGKAHCIEVQNGDFDTVRKSSNIQRGDMVLFCTGMSDGYYDPDYFTVYPAMTLEVADYLIEIGVKMVGLDTCSADTDEDFPIHKRLLSNNVLIIENLTNLKQLVDKTFKLYALPLKLQVDGSPARVVAELT